VSEGVSIRILDREFTIGCPLDEREALQSAAQLLDARMRGIRGENRMAAFDRVAVIAALNLAAEVHQFRRELEGRDVDVAGGLSELNRKLEALLAPHGLR